VQSAAGRIFFEMPANRRASSWNAYVCSGTVVEDAASGVSVVITAAHCVYDDVNKAFARNVLFIPDQDGTTGSGTDRDCTNDPYGCWVPAFGVVDSDWSSRKWPDNIPWDHAYYVVPVAGAQVGGPSSVPDSLEAAVGALRVSFATPTTGMRVHALGYPGDRDPDLRHCADALTAQDSTNWWIAACTLQGGASGGPWLQPFENGDGVVVSVNSWGYATSPGMAGPRLDDGTASCLHGIASSSATVATDRGVVATC